MMLCILHNPILVLGYHSIPKINWGSFQGHCEEKWGSFWGQFGDHFRVGEHFGVLITSGAVQMLCHPMISDNVMALTVCADILSQEKNLHTKLEVM